jgi:hypothetical protein
LHRELENFEGGRKVGGELRDERGSELRDKEVFADGLLIGGKGGIEAVLCRAV